MSMIANEVALSQLKKALDVLEAPHDKLPKVTDKNGNEVTDAREKRLQLVGEYVQNAGDIISLINQGNTAIEMGLQAALSQKYRGAMVETVKRLTGGKLPPGFLPQDGLDADEEEEDGPGARRMGFAAVLEEMERAKNGK